VQQTRPAELIMLLLGAYTFKWVLKKERIMALAMLSLTTMLCFVLLSSSACLLTRKRLPCVYTISSESLVFCHYMMPAGIQLVTEILL
jgi:hypothetical protein